MKECVYCKRTEDKAVLNHEGWLHHKEPLRCLDTKTCQRIVRKTKRKAKQDGLGVGVLSFFGSILLALGSFLLIAIWKSD